MKKPLYLSFIACILLLCNLSTFAQPANNNCGAATPLPPSTDVAGTVWQATASGTPVGCALGNPDDDVWFSFTSGGTVATITLSGLSSEMLNSGAMMQLYSNTCGSLVSVKCANGSSGPLVANGLTNSATYYVRVYCYATGALSSSGASAFTIRYSPSITPSNDNYTGAITIPTNGAATPTTGWFAGATTSGTLPNGACTTPVNWDVWYKFTATRTNASVTLANAISGGVVPGNTRIQVLSGAPGGTLPGTFTTSVNCGVSPLALTGLTVGTTYYVRVYNTGGAAFTTGSANKYFNVSVIDAGTPPVADSTTALFFMDTVAKYLGFPWEIAYGPDDSLWITEAKGYRVVRISKNRTGASKEAPVNQVLKLPLGDADGNPGPTFGRTVGTWPQGGMQGLAVHPEFKSDPTKQFVYLSYVYAGTCGSNPPSNTPCIFRTKIVRCQWYYAAEAGNPYPGRDTLVIKDTILSNLSGSNDHNSGRLKIGPVKEGPDNTYKLYYTIGDMGAGQFNNDTRTNYAQNRDTLEGKILRLNTEPDADVVTGSPHEFNTFRKWIPNDNPYTHTVNGFRTPVYSYGHRNAQGISWGFVNGSWNLYESEHGDRTGDEVNIIEEGENYGWPKVTGVADDNYNTFDNLTNGFNVNDVLAGLTVSDEKTFAGNAADFKKPIFDMFNWSAGQLQALDPNNIYTWPTIGASSIEFYGGSIPGWKNSLLVAGLKYGIFRLKLNAAGTAIDSTVSTNATDTFPIMHGWRVRDMAISPVANSGKIWVIMDSTGSTSGPTGGFSGGTITAKDGGKVIMLTYKGLLTLPVNFVSFTGKLLTNKTIRLEWKAETDIEHDHFEVEKSADGVSFSAIGMVTGGRSPYSFIDQNPFEGDNFYRIKQLDRNGKITYSKVINVVYDPNKFIMNLYPNPFKDVLTLKISTSKPDRLQIQVYDMQGHMMYSESKFVQNAVEVTINSKAWPSQMYSVKVISSDNKVLSNQKIIKQ